MSNATTLTTPSATPSVTPFVVGGALVAGGLPGADDFRARHTSALTIAPVPASDGSGLSSTSLSDDVTGLLPRGAPV